MDRPFLAYLVRESLLDGQALVENATEEGGCTAADRRNEVRDRAEEGRQDSREEASGKAPDEEANARQEQDGKFRRHVPEPVGLPPGDARECHGESQEKHDDIWEEQGKNV